MKDVPQNIQDRFLNAVRQKSIPVSIITTNGYQIKNAHITAFDNFVIMASNEEHEMIMLFKHAISSIIPAQKVALRSEKEE